MKFNYTKKALVISIFIFIVVIILDVLFTSLLIKQINNINNKVKQLDISFQERLRDSTLKDSIFKTEIEREKLAGYFVGVSNAEIVEFTKYLENLATGFNLTQKKTLNYEPALGLESSAIVSTLRFKFNVSGQWSNVFNFIQAVENLPKVSYLTSVSAHLNSEALSVKEIKSLGRVWTADLDFSVINLKN